MNSAKPKDMIGTYKSVICLYIMWKESKKKPSRAYGVHKIKYLEVDLTKKVEDFYTEDHIPSLMGLEG